ncbi:sensor domain-containing diguanylate cyclase [bacterium]|nr:sensor domain-containing diguanylate cyclase [bacterium]
MKHGPTEMEGKKQNGILQIKAIKIAVCSLLAVAYWLVESAVDAFVFNEGSWISQVITPAPQEIWTRSVVAALLVVLCVFYYYTTLRHSGAERALRQTQMRLGVLLGNLPKVVLYETGGGREFISENIFDWLGYAPETLTRDRSSFVDLIHPEDKPRLKKEVKAWHDAGEPDVLTMQFRVRRVDGEYIWVEDRMVQVRPKNAKKYMAGVMVDITERKLAEQKIHELATHDSLTGLLNRREFHRLLAHEIERAGRYHRVFSLLMIDVDRFKDVNDTYGHLVGDEVLKRVVETIKEGLRTIDAAARYAGTGMTVIMQEAGEDASAARYGGEEMAILMPETDKQGATLVAERIRRMVSEASVTIESGKSVSVTISVGVATFPEDGIGEREIVAAADLALYAAKDAGRNKVRVSQAEEAEEAPVEP